MGSPLVEAARRTGRPGGRGDAVGLLALERLGELRRDQGPAAKLLTRGRPRVDLVVLRDDFVYGVGGLPP